jgi:L-rhamnose mutarotase
MIALLRPWRLIVERRAWILKVKKGKGEEYVRAHDHVWSELVQAARAAGFRNHTVFFSGSTVVAYVEAEDMEAANARMKDAEVKRRWDLYMSDLLESTDSPSAEEIFHFD